MTKGRRRGQSTRPSHGDSSGVVAPFAEPHAPSAEDDDAGDDRDEESAAGKEEAVSPSSAGLVRSTKGRPGRGGRVSAPNSASAGSSRQTSAAYRDRKQLKADESTAADLADLATLENKRAIRGRAAKARGKTESTAHLELEELERERQVGTVDAEGLDDEDGEEGSEGVTRCVCGQDTEEMASGLMIQCDTCKCWQHGPCVGLWGEKDCPDRYFCESCRPGWHGPGGLLRKAHRKAQTPSNLTHHRPSSSLSAIGQPEALSPTLPAGGAGTQSIPPSSRNNKPRESADAALVAAFLAESQVLKPSSSSSPPGPGTTPGGQDSAPNSPIKGERESSQHLASSSHQVHYHHHHGQPGGGSSRSPSPSLLRDGVEAAGDGGGSGSGRRGGRGTADESKVAPKKRSTMNSRDAAYDDAIAMSILGPGSAAMRARLEKSREGGLQGEASASGALDGVEDHDDDMDCVQSLSGGSGSRESSKSGDVVMNSIVEPNRAGIAVNPNTSSAADPTASPPNERANVSRADSTLVSLTSAAAPAPPPHPSRGPRSSPSKRGGAGGGGATIEHAFRSQRPRDWAPAETGGWGLPEHLKHLSHLLPTPLPVPLQVPTWVKATGDGSGVEGGKDHSRSTLVTTTTTPTRVRFPNKRMTMPEMRKRARNVLDYLTKVQIEMSEREKRNEVVHQVVAGSDKDGVPSSTGGMCDGVSAVPVTAETVSKPASDSGQVESMRLMDALTKDIIMFQQKYFGSTE